MNERTTDATERDDAETGQHAAGRDPKLAAVHRQAEHEAPQAKTTAPQSGPSTSDTDTSTESAVHDMREAGIASESSGPQPLSESDRLAAQSNSGQEPIEPLFVAADRERLRDRWRELQIAFVDDPRAAVEQAHELVGATIDQLTASYADRHKRMSDEWSSGAGDTEALRTRFREYRVFFQQLLST
ncbi:hypothetical protein [Nocardia arthritidis]|uniref:Uncharacterized protein n=1 Tax=Nocardia arthritidis TaxID=228602 RepID=A0A6G9YEA3_9NOCA|nr:hypothetical protein [Nocardia arthritidis]QIS11376.1 hypothetical protein F5544_17500 [Nocardia arthritidis]